jgi:polyisoprenoid-binding protein YceI
MKKTKLRSLLSVIALLAGSLATQAPVAAQQLILQFDPSGTGADITLAGNLHTVEGTFTFKSGSIHFDPATGVASGEVVFDATSGRTGNSSRDKKMHKDVIGSQRYPEIVFRPDHAAGALAASGESTLQVHGKFAIHGAEHEVTIPVQMNLQGNSWTAKASFTIPYVKWGMKNPSVLFFRVGDEVSVRVHAAGSLTH